MCFSLYSSAMSIPTSIEGKSSMVNAAVVANMLNLPISDTFYFVPVEEFQ